MHILGVTFEFSECQKKAMSLFLQDWKENRSRTLCRALYKCVTWWMLLNLFAWLATGGSLLLLLVFDVDAFYSEFAGLPLNELVLLSARTGRILTDFAGGLSLAGALVISLYFFALPYVEAGKLGFASMRDLRFVRSRQFLQAHADLSPDNKERGQ